jgi:hypothetical protein
MGGGGGRSPLPWRPGVSGTRLPTLHPSASPTAAPGPARPGCVAVFPCDSGGGGAGDLTLAAASCSQKGVAAEAAV